MRCLVIAVWAICWALFPAAAAAAAVDAVAVRVKQHGGAYPLPPLLEKRMEASVRTIADHVLTGRRVAAVAAGREEYERLIREVFARILVGYTVERVTIAPGTQTHLEVSVTPWQDIVRRVDVEVTFAQIPAAAEPLARGDIAGLERSFAQALEGLPIDAAEWTRGALRSALREFLTEHLPEFRGDFELVPGEVTRVQVLLYPQGPLIREVALSLRSDSLPNAALLTRRTRLQARADQLVGLPVAFAQRHQAYFTREMTAGLDQDRLLQDLAARAAVRLEAGEKTEVAARVDTDRYLIYLEGYLDIGRDGEETSSFKFHAGKFISPVDEIFLETDFLPHRVRWVWMPGWARTITPQLTAGVRYDLNEGRGILWLKQRLGERWLIRVEHTDAADFSEFAARYRLHDFVALEYVVSSDDHWLRMVGNF